MYLWARVGMRFDVSEDERKLFLEACEHDYPKAKEMLWRWLHDGTAKICGETYFPNATDSYVEGNPQHDTDFYFEEEEE